jgi:hypothetical protein
MVSKLMERSTLNGPLIVLFEQDGAHQAKNCVCMWEPA